MFLEREANLAEYASANGPPLPEIPDHLSMHHVIVTRSAARERVSLSGFKTAIPQDRGRLFAVEPPSKPQVVSIRKHFARHPGNFLHTRSIMINIRLGRPTIGTH